MERLPSLKMLVWVIAAIIAGSLVLLYFMLRPGSIHVWLMLAVITLLDIFLVRLSLGLIDELINKEKNL